MGLSVQKQGQRSALSLTSTLLREECVLVLPMAGCRHLDRTDINATIHDPWKTSAALIHPQRWITRLDCRAI
jgi:hypothetical protein